jgi:predicted lipoprotein with Yx(FWY)xxD motif
MRKSLSLPFALAACSLLAACGSSSSKTQSSSESTTKPASGNVAVVVKTVRNPSLNAIILTDTHGMTLYHLSAEQNGKFICTTAACVSIWHPLTVAAGSTPAGATALVTVKRPDGSLQVAYKGQPLYTFAQDTAAGQVKGQGVKDVGTWSAAQVTSSEVKPATTTTTTTTSEGGGYKY